MSRSHILTEHFTISERLDPEVDKSYTVQKPFYRSENANRQTMSTSSGESFGRDCLVVHIAVLHILWKGLLFE